MGLYSSRPTVNPLHIRAELLKRGYTLRAIADELDLSDRTIGNVIRGYGKSRRVARHIARLLGRPVSKLWPGQYDERAV